MSELINETSSHWEIKHGLSRWKIEVELETASPLHIGNGETTHRDEIPADINACIKGKNDLPIIPGSTFKGIMRAWLFSLTENNETAIDKTALDMIFGKGYQSEEEQGAAGLVAWHDAHIIHCLESRLDGEYPYWNDTTQTCIETSTAINRHTGSALHESLHYFEAVPPGVRFALQLSGLMSEEYAGLIVAALNLFGDGSAALGAKTSTGNGLFNTYGLIRVHRMDVDDIIGWLDQPDRQQAIHQMRELESSEIKVLSEKPRAMLISQSQHQITLDLHLNGPFLVRDPSVTGDEDIHPLTDRNGNPVLPGQSFKGALRSQAERIVRTLGGKCCEAGNPKKACKPVYSTRQAESDLCPICQVFGATGWKSTINIGNFISTQTNLIEKSQQFVAIDRFHGGSKAGALYNIKHFERPTLKGWIAPTSRTPDWGLGLLALLVRDLSEGDIRLGYGKNKGYGEISSVTVTDPQGFLDDETTIKAFRNRILEETSVYDFEPPLIPQETGSADVPKPTENTHRNQNSYFLNPYHFIPVTQPDTAHWLDVSKDKRKQFSEATHHSHAFYRDRYKEDKPIFNGRIICSLKTKTPLYIGAGGSQDANTDDTEPSTLQPYLLNDERAIPATSLRGLISSLAEAASNSSLRELNDATMSYRKQANPQDALEKIGLIIEQDGKHKLLPVCDRSNRIYLLGAANSGLDTWTPDQNKVYYLPETLGNKTINGHFLGKEAQQNQLQEQYVQGLQPGILRILGASGRTDMPNNKKHEFFIPVPIAHVDTQRNTFDFAQHIQDNRSNIKSLAPQAIQRFETLADERTQLTESAASPQNRHPFHLRGTRRQADQTLRIYHGSLVYFAENDRGIVTELAFSAIWRGCVENTIEQAETVYNFFPEELRPFNEKRHRISPAELMFGFIEKNSRKGLAHAGKVTLSAGILANDTTANTLDTVTLKALSSPKLPSPSLYFKNKDGSSAHIAKAQLKTSNHTVKGRKHYLHAWMNHDEVQELSAEGTHNNHSNLLPWETTTNERNHLKVRVEPIGKGVTFHFHIDFNNLSEWELGLLCYALKPDENYCHKLGLGKPLGLGSVDIQIESLLTINRSDRYLKDKLDAPRYNQHNWLSQSADQSLKDKYRLPESSSENAVDPYTLRDQFIKTMDNDIQQAISILGNPNNVDLPVHYPQLQNNNIESENFNWFVTNDRQANPPMEDLDTNTSLLPALRR